MIAFGDMHGTWSMSDLLQSLSLSLSLFFEHFLVDNFIALRDLSIHSDCLA